MSLDLLVDGRVLDRHHPGVRDFWIPILRAWATRGGGGGVVCLDREPIPDLMEVGFGRFSVPLSPRHPLASHAARALVRSSGARATLSPLYLTLTGTRRTLATVFDLIGRTHARSAPSRLIWEVALRHVVRRADVVLCATRATAAELQAAFPALRGRVRVVSPIAPTPAAFNARVTRRYRLSEPYGIAIGSHRPHKRLTPLVAAWERAITGTPLVLIGSGTELLHHPPHVYGLGWVSDTDAGSLLAGAACLVSASTAEGFGLPVLAALAHGIPIVACRQSVLHEVAGAAATWIDPDRMDHLCLAAHEIVLTPGAQAQRQDSGRLIAAEFTAERALRELATALDG